MLHPYKKSQWKYNHLMASSEQYVTQLQILLWLIRSFRNSSYFFFLWPYILGWKKLCQENVDFWKNYRTLHALYVLNQIKRLAWHNINMAKLIIEPRIICNFFFILVLNTYRFVHNLVIFDFIWQGDAFDDFRMISYQSRFSHLRVNLT